MTTTVKTTKAAKATANTTTTATTKGAEKMKTKTEVIKEVAKATGAKVKNVKVTPAKAEDLKGLPKAAKTIIPELTKEQKKEAAKKLDAEIKAAKKVETDKKETERKARLAAKKEAAAKNRQPSFTRYICATKAIQEVCKKGATLKQIESKTAEIYKEHNNQELSGKTAFVIYCIHPLVEFGKLTLENGVYKIVK